LVTLDVAQRRLDVDADLAKRTPVEVTQTPHHRKPALAKFAHLVSSASLGATTVIRTQ
jgi:hypothetical protein